MAVSEADVDEPARVVSSPDTPPGSSAPVATRHLGLGYAALIRRRTSAWVGECAVFTCAVVTDWVSVRVAAVGRARSVRVVRVVRKSRPRRFGVCDDFGDGSDQRSVGHRDQTTSVVVARNGVVADARDRVYRRESLLSDAPQLMMTILPVVCPASTLRMASAVSLLQGGLTGVGGSGPRVRVVFAGGDAGEVEHVLALRPAASAGHDEQHAG